MATDARLTRMLANVPDTLDKRQSSLIYNSLSPTNIELASLDVSKSVFKLQVFVTTATGDTLDEHAKSFGLTRKQATKAIRIAQLLDKDGNTLSVPTGSRLATPNTATDLTFVVTGTYETNYLVECEQTGTIGNQYYGTLLPLFTINNLATAAIIGTQQPAEDDETDEALRTRILSRWTLNSYGFNIAGYKEAVTGIDGVIATKVFPAWQGGNTVKVSFLASGYEPATEEFIELVQTTLDPIENSGDGYGIVPIGHRVTVTTPETVDINVSAAIVLKTGYTITQVESGITDALYDYLYTLRQEWADNDTTSVYLSRIVSAIVNVDGVDNAYDITINGDSADITLTETAELQQIPVLGVVSITE